MRIYLKMEEVNEIIENYFKEKFEVVENIEFGAQENHGGKIEYNNKRIAVRLLCEGFKEDKING